MADKQLVYHLLNNVLFDDEDNIDIPESSNNWKLQCQYSIDLYDDGSAQHTLSWTTQAGVRLIGNPREGTWVGVFTDPKEPTPGDTIEYTATGWTVPMVFERKFENIWDLHSKLYYNTPEKRVYAFEDVISSEDGVRSDLDDWTDKLDELTVDPSASEDVKEISIIISNFLKSIRGSARSRVEAILFDPKRRNSFAMQVMISAITMDPDKQASDFLSIIEPAITQFSDTLTDNENTKNIIKTVMLLLFGIEQPNVLAGKMINIQNDFIIRENAYKQEIADLKARLAATPKLKEIN